MPCARCAARSRAPTERPPISTATFIHVLLPGFPAGRVLRASGRPAAASAAGHAPLAAEQARHQRQLRAVRAPGERRAHRLEQLAALDPEPRADRVNRGFNPFRAPLRKALERRGQLAAQRAAPAPARAPRPRRARARAARRGTARARPARSASVERLPRTTSSSRSRSAARRARARAAGRNSSAPAPRSRAPSAWCSSARSSSAACRGRRPSRCGPRARARSLEQLGARQDLALVARVEAEQRQVAEQRLGHARPRAASRPPPPRPRPRACSSWCGRGSGSAARARTRRRLAQRLVQHQLARRVGQVLLGADHVGDAPSPRRPPRRRSCRSAARSSAAARSRPPCPRGTRTSPRTRSCSTQSRAGDREAQALRLASRAAAPRARPRVSARQRPS